MNPIRSRLRPAVTALALLAVAGTTTRSARAGEPTMTMSQCISANESAVKLRGEHKLRQAREQALVCAATGCPGEVRDACQKRVVELSTAIPTIVFLAKDGAGHDLVAVKVSMDGEPIADRLEGAAIPIEIGQHKFSFEVAGQAPVEQSFVISEGQKDRRETITIAAPAGGGSTASPATPSNSTPSVAGVPATPSQAAPAEAPPAASVSGAGPHTTMRAIGYVTGGVGVALFGLTAYYAVTAGSRSSDSNAAASNPDPNVKATSSTLYDQAKQAQTYAYVTGGIGIAAIATGVVLVLVSRAHAPDKVSRVRVVPAVGVRTAGLEISGTW